ncbi:MAG: hypothetical protein Q4G33_00620 [bacterium]|nr:hypothetical protein [bacterium]
MMINKSFDDEYSAMFGMNGGMVEKMTGLKRYMRIFRSFMNKKIF